MWRYAFMLMAALFAASATTLAGNKPKFEQADQNGDGKVSIKEASKAGIPKDEAKANDLDDDGKLAKADWKFVDTGSSAGDSSDTSY